MVRRIVSCLRFVLLLLCSFLSGAAWGSQLPDSLQVSLLVCEPGAEIFELYGHAAMRVRGVSDGMPVDRVYNYGLFDFQSPGFVYRFVKGETDYFSGAVPTPYFLDTYVTRGSNVREFPLNLSENEAAQLVLLLEGDVQPDRCVYRYKYFSNNCSTRLLDRLDQAVGGAVVYPQSADSTMTFRELLRVYNEGYPWYQLGIDIALGQSIDRNMMPRERMFNPMELAAAVLSARKSDGSMLSGAPVMLVGQGVNPRMEPTPWYATPLFVFWVVFAGVSGVVLWRYPRFVPWLYAFWGLIAGLAGCLVWYLTFISVHEGTSPNLLAWWLNPLWLLLPATAWIKRMRSFCRYSAAAQGLIALALLVALPFVQYSLNAALLPLLLVSVLLGAAAIKMR